MQKIGKNNISCSWLGRPNCHHCRCLPKFLWAQSPDSRQSLTWCRGRRSPSSPSSWDSPMCPPIRMTSQDSGEGRRIKASINWCSPHICHPRSYSESRDGGGGGGPQLMRSRRMSGAYSKPLPDKWGPVWIIFRHFRLANYLIPA